MRPAVLALLLLTACGCSATPAGPPEIVVDASACSRCGMLISDHIYAAAYQVPGSESRVFDDIGCLIAAARTERSAPGRLWFHDGTDAAWIAGDAAVFVASPNIKSPMGGGILAFRSESAAGAAATHYGGSVVRSLADLLNRTGDRP